MRQIRRFVAYAAAMLFGTLLASAQTSPTILTISGPNGGAPNGIAATPSELLFTQPYYNLQPRGVYKENLAGGGSSTPVYALSSHPDIPAENYLTISTGLGGFVAGSTYATGVSPTNTSMDAIFRDGTLFVDSIPGSDNHAGITFDTAGTFGFDLIATAQSTVNGYSPSAALQFQYPAPMDYVLEGATVAPLTYVACPGCLFVTGELASDVNNGSPTGPGMIFYQTPGAASGTALKQWSTTPGIVEPEGIVFVPSPNQSCTVAGSPYNYFVSGFSVRFQDIIVDNDPSKVESTSGAILAYTPAQLAPYAGQLLVPDENTGNIYAFSAPGVSTLFSSTNYQLEGSTIPACTSNKGSCPLTQGYWKNHANAWPTANVGSMNIGCHLYSNQQLVTVLETPPQKGNAVLILGHQLIAAMLNYDAGATQTPEATAAIGAALDLLCANSIDLTKSYVSSSSALGQKMVDLSNTLDSYNSAC